MSACPACGKPVDALWKGVTRIVDGRILQFCSAECAAASPSASAKPAPAAAATPAPSQVAAPSPAAAPTPATRPRSFSKPPPVASPSPEPAPAPRPVAASSKPAAVIVDDDDIPEEPQPRRATDIRRRRNRRAMWLAAGIITGGMAVAIIQTFSPAAPTDVRAARDDGSTGVTPPSTDEVPPPPEEPAALDAARARQQAEAALRALLPSPSTRIAREAAMALARTGDKEALDALDAMGKADPSTITRLAIGYAMARAGDARGTEILRAGLKGKTRDVRADAARYLALLGDHSAVPVLEGMMAISQYKLGAAETLARLGHKRAIAVLDAALAAPNTSHEDRMRALVALGHAGRADVAAGLREILDDGAYNVGAAGALARLRDTTSSARLLEQLAVPSLQVGAALGLRRLDPALDPMPHLPALVAALDNAKDTARVSAAEAILILTGDAQIAERD